MYRERNNESRFKLKLFSIVSYNAYGQVLQQTFKYF